MSLPTLLIFTVIQVAVQGQIITPVYVQNNAPVTLTCPADDQATTLTWTGPGGTLYVTGTTVKAGLDSSVKPRISSQHTGGSYTLTFTVFRSSDTGIYTCTVDGTVDSQMVIVQGVTSASSVYTRQGGTVTLQCPDTGGTVTWSVTSTVLLYTQGTQFNPAIPDDTRTRLSLTRQDGTYNLQISDAQLSDVREYRCIIDVTDTYYHLLLYIPPAFPEIENTVSVAGQNRTTGTEDSRMILTCNSRGGTPAASVTWIKDGTNLLTSNSTVQYTKVFTRSDDRTVYTCQSSSPALTSPQTTSVLVYLDLKPGQPTISDQLSKTENTILQVVCVSTGSRPASNIQWNVGGTWQSNNPTEVKVKDSATDTYTVTSTLSLPVTRQDNGKSAYCRASNLALSGGIESVRRSLTVLFGPDSASITGNRVVVAEGTSTLTLTCTTHEYNRQVHISWYNDTTRIPNTAGVTNTSGTYGGSVSTQVLQLTPDRYQDGNVIKCVVQNEDVTLGEKTASVTLNIHCPPSPPLYLLQKHVASSSVTVQWIPESDEGQAQTFVIGYRSDVSSDYLDLDAIPDSQETVMSFTIEGLAPDTLYHIRVYAQNDVGMSDKIDLNCSTTIGKEDNSYSTRIALICVSTVLVVVVTTSVAAFVLFRMRKTPAGVKRNHTRTNQESEPRQHSGEDHSLFNQSHQPSTYEDLNLSNLSPPSVYEDIQEQDHRPSGDNSGGNTYEVLGRTAAPNVYETL